MPNPRVFTIREASALIPRLSEILPRLMAKQKVMQTKHDALLVMDLLAADQHLDYSRPDGELYVERAQEMETLLMSFQEEISSLVQMGCVLKNIENGSVDFLHVRSGALVYLCWRLDEVRIDSWHNLDAERCDRKPLW